LKNREEAAVRFPHAAPERARVWLSAFAAGALLLAPGAASIAAEPLLAQAGDLADLSLEELGNIPITSVSKRPEPLAEAPASVFVITGEDIRRSGANTLPEALRLAPNLQVARVDARNYAITARGFNSAFSNKMLMLIDGRTVYTPLFSGVFWDAQDVLLEDIERIEVISGPGGTLWGTNAVNGVINVITRSAKDTQGALAAAGGSDRENGSAVRYGGETGNGGHYRVYGKSYGVEDLKTAGGNPDFFGMRRTQVGFRTDWGELGETGEGLTLQGDAYGGELHQPPAAGIDTGGANLLARWNKRLAGGSSVRLQAYYDRTERDQPLAFRETLDTMDVEAQHTVRLGTSHDVVWGAGYRFAWDRVDVVPGSGFAFLPAALDLRWSNVFAQDEIALPSDVRLTLGMKLEHNIYTGTEKLPSARLAWKPAAGSLLWAAASRAVRAPSRIDRDLFAPPAPIVIGGQSIFVLAGGPNFVSETVNAYEIGYRAQPARTVSYSLTAFYNTYDKLKTTEPGALGLNFVSGNNAEGHASGVEAWSTWQPLRTWRLSGGLVVQAVRLDVKPESADTAGGSLTALGNDPSHYWTLRSSVDLSEDKQLDVDVRGVGGLPNPAVPAYTAVDVRLGWRVRRDTEVSLGVQNLLDPSHVEFGAAGTASEVPRTVFLKVVWRT
jgi:iron complex outermembrane recepter protein